MNQSHLTNYLTAVSFCAAFILAPVAHATMPNLTPEPKPATPEACRAWAKNQSDDAMDMWGIQEDGTSSPEVAVQRLTASCLGQPVPEIVVLVRASALTSCTVRSTPSKKSA